MAANRRTPSRGRRSRDMAGPGRGPAGRTTARARSVPGTERRRPRLTGRAAILVLVLAVLAVSWASSFRAYFQQQQQIAALRAQIEDTGQDIEALEGEKRRWKDKSYVQQQARERFGYVMPGEKSYQVLDEDGRPLDSPDTLGDSSDVPVTRPTPWWDSAWDSVESAGYPPKPGDAERVGTIKAPGE